MKTKSTYWTKKIVILWLTAICPLLGFGQSFAIYGKVLHAEDGLPVAGVSVYLETTQQLVKASEDGQFHFTNLSDSTHQLIFYKEGYSTLYHTVDPTLDPGKAIEFRLEKLNFDLDEVEVMSEADNSYGIRNLRKVEGVAIYAAKKSEVIQVDFLIANLATNNARQIYKGIAGLNIWESDGAGLQLSIGARGLDPNRSSNFNTRQNGYDISADALGYPESYYTPPAQALQRIEIVRGAASLQYGSQFGGLLNFVFKKGNEKKPIEFLTENTIGSFGFKSTFNSLGGSKSGWNYYTFYQHKQGDGWRPNSAFSQHTAYARLSKSFFEKLSISAEYTFMHYLAQQAGGLQDFEFLQNARQSNRARNWFQVNWNLAALTMDYRISDKTKLNSRSFLLSAERQALGELGPINRPDPLRDRDMVRGNYRNFGNESRLITRYNLGFQPATFLAGVRYYQGYTHNYQGDASDASDADFTFLNPRNLERSEYEFPSRNIAVFAEHIFNLGSRWSIAPGARFEYIRTASEGYYKSRVFSGGQVIFEQTIDDVQQHTRSFVLLGAGVGYDLSNTVEVYGNFSQNFRSINFSDLAIVNPNLMVDSLLEDERGYNADLGIRGTVAGGAIKFDASVFYLRYKNRIGLTELVVPDPLVIERTVAFRTNIGDARIIGLEAYAEADLWKLTGKNTLISDLTFFTNVSWLQGTYLSGGQAVLGNSVELIPPVNIKTGLNFRWKRLKASYQFSFTGQQYSDATNADFVVDATRGKIPAYQVQDVSLSYELKRFKFQAGVNNLLDERYFTRRAVAYPGPGIIPADGRSFYGTLAIRF